MRIMTCGALLDILAFFPDVLSILVFVVTRIAGINIALGMFGVGKINRSLAIGFLNLVFDENFIGKFLLFGGICRGGCHQKVAEKKTENCG